MNKKNYKSITIYFAQKSSAAKQGKRLDFGVILDHTVDSSESIKIHNSIYQSITNLS